MYSSFSYLHQIKDIGGEVHIYAKVNGFYGWYKLVPVELPDEGYVDNTGDDE